MDGDDVAMLHTKVVSHDTVDAGTAVIEIIIRQHDQNGVLALLALYQNCVATEELERLHGIVGKSDHGIVIVDRIGHTVRNDHVSVSSSCI